MKNLVLLIGLSMAILVGFCMGIEYRKVSKPLSRKGRGYSVIEAGVIVTHLGDTVRTRDFSRNSHK
jgi:hypothetical protein